MAEQVASAAVAARIGMSGVRFDALRTAMAKARTSEAAHQVCAIAHAIHGAIGVDGGVRSSAIHSPSETVAVGFRHGELSGQKRLGEARLAAPPGTSVDFVRLNLQDED